MIVMELINNIAKAARVIQCSPGWRAHARGKRSAARDVESQVIQFGETFYKHMHDTGEFDLTKVA